MFHSIFIGTNDVFRLSDEEFWESQGREMSFHSSQADNFQSHNDGIKVILKSVRAI